MRRLHIRIQLPSNTEDALRNAYGPANDKEWMIPFNDNATVENVAAVIQTRYQSRYPDISKVSPLRIRKISDGYGMVPDSGSLVHEVWEERKSNIPAEEYTVYATRDALSDSEITLLRQRLESNREFSMPPDSSARIQKRPLNDETRHFHRLNQHLATQRSSTKRTRVDRLPLLDDYVRQTHLSPHRLNAGQGARHYTPIAVEDSQPVQETTSARDPVVELDQSLKSESPEGDTTNFTSLAASQLNSTESSSEEYESAGETNTTDAPQGALQESVPGPDSSIAPVEPLLPMPFPHPVRAEWSEQDVFDVPEDDGNQAPSLLARSSASETGGRPMSPAGLLSLNRRTNADRSRSEGAVRQSSSNGSDSAQHKNRTNKSPAFRSPLILPPESEIEDDADDEHLSSNLQKLVNGIRKRKYRRSKSRSEEESAATPSASPPAKRGRTQRSQSQDGIYHSPQQGRRFHHDVLEDIPDKDKGSSNQAPKRAAAKKSREASKRLYDQLRDQEDDWAEMMQLDSSQQQQASTPSMTQPRLKSALKGNTPRAETAESSTTSDASKGSEVRRSVSFSDLPLPTPSSAKQPQRATKQAKLPKTLTSKVHSAASDTARNSDDYRKVPPISYFDAIWKMRSGEALSQVPGESPASAQLNKVTKVDKESGLGRNTPGSNESNRKQQPQNEASRKTPTRTALKKAGKISPPRAPISTPTPERTRLTFEIRGDDIRSSAKKAIPQPDSPSTSSESENEVDEGTDNESGPEAAGASAQTSTSNPVAAGLKDSQVSIETKETSEDEVNNEVETNEQIDSAVQHKEATAQVENDDDSNREATPQKAAKRAVQPTTAAAFVDASAEEDSESDSEASEPEDRSPARQVDSSADSESESQTSSEEEDEELAQKAALSVQQLNEAGPEIVPQEAGALRKEDPAQHPVDNDEHSSSEDSSRPGSDSKSDHGAGRNRPVDQTPSEPIAPDSHSASGATSSASDSEESESSTSNDGSKGLPARNPVPPQNKAQPVKTPPSFIRPAIAPTGSVGPTHSFNAIRQQSLNESAQSKLPAYKNPKIKTVSNSLAAKLAAVANKSDSESDSESEDSDSSDDSGGNKEDTSKRKVSAFQNFTNMMRGR